MTTDKKNIINNDDKNTLTANTITQSMQEKGAAFPSFFTLASPPPMATTTNSNANITAEEDRKTCNKYVRSGLNRNVTVKFLMERLISLGCEPPRGFIRCIDCGNKRAGGGFGVVEETTTANNVPLRTINPPITMISKTKEKEANDHSKYLEEAKIRREKRERRFRTLARNDDRDCNNGGDGEGMETNLKDLQDQITAQNEGRAKLRLLPEIFLCQQHLVNEEHAHQSMVHELIHAIDLCRTKMDPINNCVHMACTEIRSENLSGECNITRELVNNRISNFKGHGGECVKRRAALSVKANPNCAAKAEDYVDAAFDRCFQDTFPFDRHPNLR